MVWKTQERKGRTLTTNPVLFTPDSKFFFGTAENQINLYPATSKGDIVRVLTGHTDLVTSLALDSKNPQLLYSASVDGSLKVWNFVTATLVASKRIGHPILELQYDSTSSTLYYVAEVEEGNGYNYELNRISFSSENNKFGEKEFLNRWEKYSPKGMILTPSNRYLVIVNSVNLLVYRIKDGSFFQFRSRIMLLCLAVSPKERIAVGNSVGEIIIFINLLENLPKTSPEEDEETKYIEDLESNKLHWHAHGVDCMVFADDGETIASGGSEGTLSITHIQSGRQNFFSKVGSFVKAVSISPDESHYAINVTDNIIRIYDAFKKVCVKVITGFKNDPFQGKDFKGTLSFYPRLPGVITVSGRTSLQSFRLAKETSFAEVEILSAGGMLLDDSLEVGVQFFAYNFDGTSLVTVDSRTLSAMENETSLKFWSLDGKHKKYNLNTTVTDNTGIQYTSCSFNPKHEMILTTNSKGKFHLWEKQAKGNEEEAWHCKWSGEYKREKTNCGCWSDDGSLFAVGCGNTLTLWNPNQPDKVQAELVHPKDETVQRASFVAKGPYLVTCTERHVYLWNLFTLSVQWSFSAPCSLLASDSTGRFVIYVQKIILNDNERNGEEQRDFSNGRYELVKPQYEWKGKGRRVLVDAPKEDKRKRHQKVEGNLVLFSSKSPIPMAVWNTGSDPIQSVAFQVDKQSKEFQSTIAYITKSQEVYSIEEVDVDHSISEAEQTDLKTLKPSTEENGFNILNRIDPNLIKVDDDKEKSKVPSFSSTNYSAIFNQVWESSPVHALPLPSSIYSVIMDNLTKKKVTDIQTTQIEERQTNGVDYEYTNGGAENKNNGGKKVKRSELELNEKSFMSMVDFFKQMNVDPSQSTGVMKRERSGSLVGQNGSSQEVEENNADNKKPKKTPSKSLEKVESKPSTPQVESSKKKTKETPNHSSSSTPSGGKAKRRVESQ